MASGPNQESTPGRCTESLWESRSHPPAALNEDCIHVWRIALESPDAPLAAARQILTSDEIRRADRFVRPEHGRRFIVARAALRNLLARYLNTDAVDVLLKENEYGKPLPAGEFAHSRIQFNLTHSGELALACFCLDKLIGIDIEQDRPLPDMLKIAKRFFAPREVDDLLAVEPSQQQGSFYACWTRKEAYIKARGEGLHHSLKRFVVSLAPGEPPVLLHTDDQPDGAQAWTLYNLYPADGYIASLASQSPPRQTKCFAYRP